MEIRIRYMACETVHGSVQNSFEKILFSSKSSYRLFDPIRWRIFGIMRSSDTELLQLRVLVIGCVDALRTLGNPFVGKHCWFLLLFVLGKDRAEPYVAIWSAEVDHLRLTD